MVKERSNIIKMVFLSVSVVFLVKLFAIQVLSSKYADLADDNVILQEIEYPYRGLIYDRNGKLIVYNTPEYDLYAISNKLSNLDSTKFCEVFQLSREELKEKFNIMKSRQEYSPEKPTLLMSQISNIDFAKIEDRLDEFNGLYIQTRTTRAYTAASSANVLGYVSEVSKAQLRQNKYKNYQQGDYVGQSGLEAFYEPYLKGKRGTQFKLRNVKGIEKGKYENGKYDTPSKPGKNLTCTIDIDLQKYGELLMAGKSGSIVALQPASGEILTLISGPSYDPNLLTGKEYSTHFAQINADTNKPLFNRPLMAQYRPGSIFKIAQAMVALQEGVIIPNDRIYCNRFIINCHGNHIREDLRGAIANSCNPYFYEVFRRMINQQVSDNPYKDARIGLVTWNKYIESLGFGKKLGIDLPNEKTGLIPAPSYYDRAYHNKPWKFSNIFSLAIGEGENLVVPIQMANFAAIIANRGYYYRPHLIKSIESNNTISRKYLEKQYTDIDSLYFEVAADAMQQVVESGTGQYRARLDKVIVCGKTGTVQNDPLPDHSVFIAFAPRDNPEIAISVYVENSGQGARAAASIASLMIEKYLFGKTDRPYIEQYVLNGNFLH